MGLAGLEPAASSLSGIEGSPLCRWLFSQVARVRQGRSNAVLATSFEAVQAAGLFYRLTFGGFFAPALLTSPGERGMAVQQPLGRGNHPASPRPAEGLPRFSLVETVQVSG